MNWVTLALMSAFFLASADAVTKRYLSKSRASEIILVRFGLSGLLLLPILLMQDWPRLNWVFWGWMAALIPLEIIAMLLYIRAITRSPLALTLPYLSFTPVFNTLTGYLILGETVSFSGFMGVMMIVSGAWLLNLDRSGHQSWGKLWEPFRAISRQSGARIMLLVAAIYSLTSVMGKAAMLSAESVSPEFFGPFYFVTLGAATTVLFLVKDRSTFVIAKRFPWVNLLLGLLMAGMVVSHFYALQGTQVAYMIAVKRMSLLFGILYGAYLFKEKGLRKNLFAGVLMVLGIYLIV